MVWLIALGVLVFVVVGGNLSKPKGHRRSGMSSDLIGVVILAFFAVIFLLVVWVDGGGINGGG